MSLLGVNASERGGSQPVGRPDVAIVTFFIHWNMMFIFQHAIDRFRARLYWIYRTYFNGDELHGLDLPIQPEPSWVQLHVAAGFVLVSFVGFVLTAIYLWSVR